MGGEGERQAASRTDTHFFGRGYNATQKTTNSLPLLVSLSLSITVLSHTRIRFHSCTGTQSRIVLSPLPRLIFNPYSPISIIRKKRTCIFIF